MRAIVISRFGGPEVLELRDRPVPDPGPGQLLVDVAAAGINFRDVYERTGAAGYSASLPIVAGVEGAGTVRAVGPGVEGFAPGDRVAWASAQGSYAEQVAVDAARAVRIPEGVTEEQAAAVLLQGMTAHYLCMSTYPVRSGDTVLVHAAAGGVGLLLVQMIVARGGRVIATTSTSQKAELARGAGAWQVVGYEGFAGLVLELTGGEGVPAVYDGVGRTTFDESLDSLRPRGMLVLFGYASGQPAHFDVHRLNAGSLFLTRPSLGHYTATPAELRERAKEVFDLVASGRLNVRIGGRYALADARRAHEDLEARRTTGKLLLIPGE